MHRPGVHFEILSNPEFLAAGTAVTDLLYPDRILTTNVWSELAKLVANSMFAQRISSINSISSMCEQTGADVDEVARAIGVDPRIGNKFLMAGIGFGGSCFKKDVLNLVYLADTMGLPEVGEYWRQVVKMNDYARDRFTNRVIRCLNNTLVGKVTILGYAFKKDTSDTLEAPALEMIKTLLEERPREIAIFDPCCNPLVVKDEIRALVGVGNSVWVYGNAYDACRDSTAVVIATEFDEFRNQPAAGAAGAGAHARPQVGPAALCVGAAGRERVAGAAQAPVAAGGRGVGRPAGALQRRARVRRRLPGLPAGARERRGGGGDGGGDGRGRRRRVQAQGAAGLGAHRRGHGQAALGV